MLPPPRFKMPSLVVVAAVVVDVGAAAIGVLLERFPQDTFFCIIGEATAGGGCGGCDDGDFCEANDEDNMGGNSI